MKSVIISIYMGFGLQYLINIKLGLKLSWILNKTYLTSGQVVYLSIYAKCNVSTTKVVN